MDADWITKYKPQSEDRLINTKELQFYRCRTNGIGVPVTVFLSLHFCFFFSALYIIHVGYSYQSKLYLLIWCSKHHTRWSEDTQLIHYWGERFEQTNYSKIPKRENTACKHPFQVGDVMNIFHKFNRRSDMYRKWYKFLLFIKVVKGFKHIWVKLSPCNHE